MQRRYSEYIRQRTLKTELRGSKKNVQMVEVTEEENVMLSRASEKRSVCVHVWVTFMCLFPKNFSFFMFLGDSLFSHYNAED